MDNIFIQNNSFKCLLIICGGCSKIFLVPPHQILQNKEFQWWQENGPFYKALVGGNPCCVYCSARTKFNRPNVQCTLEVIFQEVLHRCSLYDTY